MQSVVPDYHRDAMPYGLEPLTRLGEVVLLPGPTNTNGKGYKVYYTDESEMYTADFIDQSQSCWCQGPVDLELKTLDGQLVFRGADVIDEATCTTSKRHLNVEFPPEIKVGEVKYLNDNHYQVLVHGSDTMFECKREHSWIRVHPYQILTADGTEIGSFGNSTDSILTTRNLLKFPTDLDYRYKVLLLAAALQMQIRSDRAYRQAATN